MRAWYPSATACARLRAPSAIRTLRTCDLTVSSETEGESRVAICAFSSPSASSSSTSTCREVSGFGRGGVAKTIGPWFSTGRPSRIARARSRISGSISWSAREMASPSSGRRAVLLVGAGSSDSGGGRQLSPRQEALDRLDQFVSTPLSPATTWLRMDGRADDRRWRLAKLDELVMRAAEGAQMTVVGCEFDEAGILAAGALPEILDLDLVMDSEQLCRVAAATVYLERTALAVSTSLLDARRRPAWVSVQAPPRRLADSGSFVRGLMLRAAVAARESAARSAGDVVELDAGVQDRHDLIHHTRDVG